MCIRDSQLPDADHPHRIHRRRAVGGRDPDQRTGGRGAGRGQEPAQAEVGLAHRPERRGAGIRLGNRQGPGQSRGARQDRDLSLIHI